MTDHRLHDLLERATADLPARDRVGEALARTATVRRRRAAVGVATGVGAAVLAAVAVATVNGTGRPAPDPPPATSSPDATTPPEPSATPDDVTVTAPPVDPGVVQPEWDPTAPMGAQAVPGLPPSLVPPAEMPSLTGMPRAAAVVLTDDGLAAVSPDGEWQQLGLPEPQVANSGDTLALSVDGTTVSWAGRTAVWSRDVRGGPWRSVDYPEGTTPNGRWGISLVPEVAELTYVGQHSRWWELDLHTGAADELVDLPALRELAWAYPGIVGLTEGSPGRIWPGAGPAVDSGALGMLSRPSALDGRLAVLSYDSANDSAALLALDPATGVTTAMLPLGGLGPDYVAGGFLRPVAWLDATRVLLWVTSPPDEQQRLVTWDTSTGAVTRASELDPAAEYWAVAPAG